MELIKYTLTLLITLCCIDVALVNCNKKVESVRNKDENQEDEYTVFEPTSEWKPLRKDQVISRGLHVRINMANGKREAKLLDSDEKSDDDNAVSTVYSEKKEEDKLSAVKANELKYNLRKIKDERLLAENDLEKAIKKFRSFQELKEELVNLQTEVKADLELKEELLRLHTVVKTDLEIMKDLLSSYKQLKTSLFADDFKEELDQKELTILRNLGDLVHQIDNAQNFVKMGLKEVVFPSFNSTSNKVRYEAAKLLGTAVQNNPPAQVIAMDFGSVPILLTTLSTDSSHQVKSGALFALSCLIRRFPAAQKKFIDRGGLNTISKLFSSKTSDQIKLQMKIISFINDLLLEKKDTLLQYTNIPEMGEKKLNNERTAFEMNEIVQKMNQYEDIKLELRLKEGGWCIVFRDLFLSTAFNLGINPDHDLAAAKGYEPARPEHESIQVLSSIIACLMPICLEEFVTLSSIINELFLKYSQLVKIENDQDSLFAQLQSNIFHLLTVIEPLSKSSVKDEL